MTSGRDEMLGRGHIDYEAEKNRREWWLNNTGGAAQDNLTVRDYFAAKAMAAMVLVYKDDISIVSEVAERAYLFADAMLKERAK